MIALLASLLIHGSFVLIAFATLKGAAISGGDGTPDGEVMAATISLAGLRGGAQPASPSPTPPAFDSLFRQVRAEQSDVATSTQKPQPKTDLAKLFAAVDAEQAAKDEAAGKGGKSSLDRGGKGAGSKANSADQADHRAKPSDLQKPGGSGTVLSDGGLWGQVKPCWDKLPNVSTVPVTLLVSLNNQGLIDAPPKIVRPNSTPPDQGRLTSEARALTAIASCVPYHTAPVVGAKRLIEVRFGMGRGPAGQTTSQR
jgi:hypothetical protein